MIVYVESNFVLELALEQEQHAAVLEIKRLAARQKVTLAIPALALVEPFWTLIKNENALEVLTQQLDWWVHQLKRSREHKHLRRPELAEIARSQRERLDGVVAGLVKVARTIPLTSDILAQALIYQQSHALEVFDAIMYASVVANACSYERAIPKCFLDRDGDFLAHKAELERIGCRLIGSFEDGAKYIRHAISRQQNCAAVRGEDVRTR